MSSSRSVSIQLLSALAISSLLLSGISAAFTGEDREATFAAPELLLAQNDALDAFFNSQYDFLDASILASFFGSSLTEAKTVIGNKILNGPIGKALLAQTLLDARVSALGSLEELRYFVDMGYTFEDAEALADFWGEPSAYEAKLRIELNLIWDQQQNIDTSLALSRS